MSRISSSIIFLLCLAGCAADQYHADPAQPPTMTVYEANRTCGWESVRGGEMSTAGVAGIPLGFVGGGIGGAAVGLVAGSMPNPHATRQNACMAKHGWALNAE
jgi:hypothetical protein